MSITHLPMGKHSRQLRYPSPSLCSYKIDVVIFYCLPFELRFFLFLYMCIYSIICIYVLHTQTKGLSRKYPAMYYEK